MLRDLLRREGQAIGRRHVATLMRRRGLAAGYRKPHRSRRPPAPQVSPYLLRHLAITRPTHVWAADITDIPLSRGFVSRFAGREWASRRVWAWRRSHPLTTDVCREAVHEARAS